MKLRFTNFLVTGVHAEEIKHRQGRTNSDLHQIGGRKEAELTKALPMPWHNSGVENENYIRLGSNG